LSGGSEKKETIPKKRIFITNYAGWLASNGGGDFEEGG